jgi:two-component system, OmpR family, sensor histidine kinase TctE
MKPIFDHSHWSLTRRQLIVIGGALSGLAIVLAVGGAWFIGGVAERTSDRMLAASVHSIIETTGVEAGEVTLEMPPGAFGMLEDNARDNVYYAVHQGTRLLTGYDDFPKADIAGMSDGSPTFRYDRYLDQRVRVVTEIRHLPQMALPVVVQVAETLDERGALTRRMLIGLVLLELTLVGFAVLLIWPAIRWGLKPVTLVQQQMENRDPAKVDFAPLPLDDVPPELAGLVQGFNRLLGQLGTSTARAQRFTADASHQLRTPLAALRANIDLLKNELPADAKSASSIADIQEATDRLQRLLTQLLALARAEQDEAGGAVSSSDAQSVARAVSARFAPAAAARGLDLIFEAETTFPVQVDELLLEELLANLVDNAIRYNTDGTYVIVRVRHWENVPLIEVEDDGRGIPAHLRERAKERFFRLPNHMDKPGSGLGLSIAIAICQRAGAHLCFRDRENPQAFIIEVRFGPSLSNCSH